MTAAVDQLGPVDYLVVEFPGSNFTGEIMPELVDLLSAEDVASVTQSPPDFNPPDFNPQAIADKVVNAAAQRHGN